MDQPVIISAVRTPVGRYMGALKDVAAYDLARLVLEGAVKRAGVQPDRVDEVIMNPTRVTMKAKDPRGFAEFQRHLSEHSAEGSANTMLGYQARRPSLYDLTAEMAGITAPLLVIAGDEDPSTIEPSLLIKRTVPGARLAMLPRTGHMLNLEEPALFNRLVEDFFHQVEAGRARD